MQVLSNHGATTFTGLNEVGFNGSVATVTSAISSFTSSASWVQNPATATLNWSVTGNINSLEISGIGDVTAQSDPEVVIGLVNHALGSTKIQVWAPGISHTTATRTYQLYDEAVARILAASAHGETKGVLWHQGEYLGGFFTPSQLALPAYSDENSHVDGDGIDSLLEFAFLTDPSLPDSPQPYRGATVNIPEQGDFSALTFRRRLDSGAPASVVEISSNLQTWRFNGDGQGPDVTVEHGTPVANGDGTETVTVRMLAPISASKPAIFIRLRVRLP